MLKLNGKVSTTNRLELSQIGNKWKIDFSSIIFERLDLYKLTTFSPNKKLPVHNWFQYLQAYSAPLVDLLITELGCSTNDVVLDPWCGVGTTNLVCKSKSVVSHGIDISPLAVFVSSTKLNGPPNNKTVMNCLKTLTANFENVSLVKADSTFDIVNKSIPSNILLKLNLLKYNIKKVKDKKLADFLFLAMLNSLSQLSIFKKDGAHYRFIDKPHSDDVFGTFQSNVLSMLSNQSCVTCNHSLANTVSNIYTGDSRKLHMIEDNSIDFIITSPPYLNRDNYIAQHKLDLMFGDFVTDFKHYRDLTFSTLRSHVEAKHSGYDHELDLPALGYYVGQLEQRKEHLNNNCILTMFQGYFVDMHYSLQSISRVLKKNGKAAIVIGNSCWAGISIEVDKLLAEIALNHGLRTKAIWVTRYKLNSAQQIATFGKIPIRESIMLLEKL